MAVLKVCTTLLPGGIKTVKLNHKENLKIHLAELLTCNLIRLKLIQNDDPHNKGNT
jgi:hypothetical protein